MQTAHSSGHYHQLMEAKNIEIQKKLEKEKQAASLVLYSVGTNVEVDDNYGSWVPAVITAVLEGGQAYSCELGKGLKRNFVPATGVRVAGGRGDGSDGEVELHDWDKLQVQVEKTLDFFGKVTVESRQSGGKNTGRRGDVLEYYKERLEHYDLTKTGWIRHKEFSHATEDAYGWSMKSMKSMKSSSLSSSSSSSSSMELQSVVESLFPFIDPEGRGHVEYGLLLEHIQAHVTNIVSKDRTMLDKKKKTLKKLIKKKIKKEKEAKSKWTHQPALMVASWSAMNEAVFSGVPDTNYSSETGKESLSVTLDSEAMYGQVSFEKGATLQKSWLNRNLSPERKREEATKNMYYVPKWSSKMFGLHAAPGTTVRRNPTIEKWNGMPVLCLNEKVGAGLQLSDENKRNENEKENEKEKKELNHFVDGVTWGHLLAGLWYQRRDVLLSLSSECRMLSQRTCAMLERTARIEDMSHRHNKNVSSGGNNRNKGRKKKIVRVAKEMKRRTRVVLTS